MRKIKVGIAGIGRLGKTHAHNLAYRIPNAELAAACSIVESELDYARAELNIKQCYGDFNAMVKEADIEAVAIVSSSGEHCWQIEAALAAGLHVYTEKPLGITIEQCLNAKSVVDAHPDKIFMIGFQRRYDPSYAYAKQKIDEGLIGKPYYVRATSIDPEKSIEVAIKYGATGGGIFLDMAIHDIDLARWYLGSEPEEIHAIGGCFLHEEFAQYRDADNACTLIKFKNGAMATLYSGRDGMHGYHVEMEIAGTKGTLRIGAVPQKNLVMAFNEHGAVTECVPYFPERFAEAYLLEMQAFIDCIEQDRKPGVTVDDGLKNTQIAAAATQSFRTGQVVCLD